MKTIGHYLSSLSLILKQSIAECKDIRLGRKIIIIESDDWGAIRVPSTETYNALKSLGYDLDCRPYEHFDGLESDEDVKALAETLFQVSDRYGHHPIFTLNYLTANPAFEKIRASNFKSYYWEPIDNTYKQYRSSGHVIELVKRGIENGVFEVEFHGREHFDIPMWLQALQEEDKDVHTAFRHGMCGIFPKDNPSRGNKYMVALKGDNEYLTEVINQGNAEFMRIWGYTPKSFIAPCYTWSPEAETILAKTGIKIIQGARFQRIPFSTQKLVHYIGQHNSLGQIYTVRNCAFEPATSSIGIDVVGKTMFEIRKALKLGVPAIISTHRINYTSRLSLNNAAESRMLLKKLFVQILQEFPDVEFSTGIRLFEQ